MAKSFGLGGVEKSDRSVSEVALEVLDELRGKGDFGDEENDGLVIL